jgi:hypothetical protein
LDYDKLGDASGRTWFLPGMIISQIFEGPIFPGLSQIFWDPREDMLKKNPGINWSTDPFLGTPKKAGFGCGNEGIFWRSDHKTRSFFNRINTHVNHVHVYYIYIILYIETHFITNISGWWTDDFHHFRYMKHHQTICYIICSPWDSWTWWNEQSGSRKTTSTPVGRSFRNDKSMVVQSREKRGAKEPRVDSSASTIMFRGAKFQALHWILEACMQSTM